MSTRHLLILAQLSNLVFGTATIATIWYVREQTLLQIQIVPKAFSFNQVLLHTVCIQRQVLGSSLGVMIAQV